VPKVRRQHIPPALFQHLLDRIQSRKIAASQLRHLATWLDTEPDVPEERKTFLPGQHPKGKRLR